MRHTPEALVEEIDSAFRERPYPGDDKIVLRQPGCQGQDAEEAWTFFHDKSWREITRELMKAEISNDAFVFMTMEGFAYFLPALMKIALDLDGSYGMADPLITHLWTFPEEISSLLGPREKRAVVHFLEHMADEFARRWPHTRNDASTALDHYWAYFTDAELGLV